MATLSEKLADITLPIDYFRSYLNIQNKVIDLELALWNFRYAEELLYDIWCQDLIFKRSVDVWYVEEFANLFENLEFEGIEKEKV